MQGQEPSLAPVTRSYHSPHAIAVRSSVMRGPSPPPGTYSPPYYWGDLLDGPPPRRQTKGEGAYALHHVLEIDSEARISHTTIVSVDPGENLDDPSDDIIHVDSRVSVQGRLFLELIYLERAMMERVTARWRERIVRRLVRQRALAKRLPYAWMRRSALAIVRAEGRAGHWAVRTVRNASRSLVEAPDSVYSRGVRAWVHLSGRIGRQGLWAGMKDPKRLTTEQKSVVLFMSLALLVGGIFLLNNIVPFLPPAFALAYRAVLTTFVFGVATAVLLPFPPSELLVIPPFLVAGPVVAFLAILSAKLFGAWIVFFIGDALHQLIENATEGRPRSRRLVDWMNRNSERFGAYILAAFMAAPFLPDTLALYVFAVSGTSFRGYFIGAAVGSVLRYGAVVGMLLFFGEARVHELFG